MGLAISRAEQLKNRERALRSLAALFTRLSALCRWRQAPLPELLQQIAAESADPGFASELLDGFREGGDLSAAWIGAAGSPRRKGLLRAEEIDVLRAFPAVLQSASASEVIGCADAAATEFADFAREAAAERMRQTRLWLGLGAFGALLTVIVLA